MLKFGKFVALSAAFAFMASMSVAIAAPTPVNQTVNQVNALSLSYTENNTAAAQDYSFQYASGNIGANIAAGVENQQANMAFIDPPGSITYNFTGKFNQTQAGTAALDGDGNVATAQNWSFQYAKGNIGLNVAAGAQNQQLNGLDILENTTNVNTTTSQLQFATGSFISGNNNARVQDYAFQYASGNIGANVAAGDINQQANTAVVMYLTPSQDSDLNTITTTTNQVAVLNINIASNSNHASTQNNAFQYAKGNIGVNVAAGVGNQQSNNLVVEP